jgi:UDP-glucose 4-epimerase
MRFVVTGGAGFIGSHVVDACLEAGHDVLVVDNLSSGRKSNLAQGARLFEGCITEAETAVTVRTFAPEVVLHLAAQIDVRVSVEEPAEDARINIAGTVTIVEAARQGGALKKVVFASTGGAIYGEQIKFPADESHPCRPLSAYGTAKKCCEEYLGWFSRLHGVSWTALRFGNVYGPRQNPHGEAGVIAIFAGRLMAGEPCTIFGDGSATRDYVFVADVVRAFMSAAERPEVVGCYNIATGVESPVNTLYARLARHAETDERPVYEDARSGEVSRSSLDTRRAKRSLGWSPVVGIDQGLAQVWDFVSSGALR